ncbi:MAG TPA: hypothetical protein VMC41_01515 [Candidatus Nanoarchaeia archaeon]|nr:hypothetical protein [Candidatus Nanoarchaeia archaeon]
MTEDKQNGIDLDLDAEGKKGAGRIFSADENNSPQVNLDEEIERNIRIRTMPRKFKISSQGTDKKTTIVGAVIMAVGFLVLAAAVYLAYIFLINPKPAAIPPASAPTSQAPAQVTPTAPSIPTPATTTAPVAPPAASSATTTPPVASSTPPAAATSTAPLATSTTAFSASSTLAHDGLPLNSNVADADHDGLSDAEEIIFGTDPNKADTDGDGYPDGAEVLSLYDPAGPGKITANPHIAVYDDAAAKYTVAYPKIWQAQNLNGGQSLIFSAADNSFIEIVSMPDTGNLSITDWYNSQFSDTPITAADAVAKNGWQGAFHQNREIFYLADAAKNNIYTISYVPAIDNNPQYYRIFLMMINSFTLK